MTVTRLPLLLRLSSLAMRMVPARMRVGLYHIPIFTPAARRLLTGSAPTGLSTVQIASGMLAGYQLSLDLKSEKYYWLGAYEAHTEEALSDFVQEGAVIYDVGAHIGYFSLLGARIAGPSGHVFAFEPLPANIERLNEHVKLNSLEKQITVVPQAVSDVVGTEEFLVHTSHSMGKLSGSRGRDITYARSHPVQSLTLDSFVFTDGNPAPDLVKMDIEGGEAKAVHGMARLLAEKQPIFFLEVHGYEVGRLIWPILEQHGYTVHHMAPAYPRLTGPLEMNWRDHVVCLPEHAQRCLSGDPPHIAGT